MPDFIYLQLLFFFLTRDFYQQSHTVNQLIAEYGGELLKAETIIHSDYAEEKTIPKICSAA